PNAYSGSPKTAISRTTHTTIQQQVSDTGTKVVDQRGQNTPQDQLGQKTLHGFPKRVKALLTRKRQIESPQKETDPDEQEHTGNTVQNGRYGRQRKVKLG